jgi:hypothetical protein
MKGCATGLWRVEGAPHKGWHSMDVIDLEDDKITCQMCQTTEVRYAHYMTHPDRPDLLLQVGCVCAERMSEGYDGKGAEKRLRARRRRRARWDTVNWRESKAGNSLYYKTRDGIFVAIVFWNDDDNPYDDEDEESYGFCVKNTVTKCDRTNKRDYRALDKAKQAAWEVLDEVREEFQREIEDAEEIPEDGLVQTVARQPDGTEEEQPEWIEDGETEGDEEGAREEQQAAYEEMLAEYERRQAYE